MKKPKNEEIQSARDKIRKELEQIQERKKKIAEILEHPERMAELDKELNEELAQTEPETPKEQVTVEQAETPAQSAVELNGHEVSNNGNGNGSNAILDVLQNRLTAEQMAELVNLPPDQIDQALESVFGGNGNGMKTPAEMDTEGYKPEVVKQAFDFPRKMSLYRSNIPDRMILPLSMMKTASYLARAWLKWTPETETAPEFWMNEYPNIRLSRFGQIRKELLVALMPKQEGTEGDARINM